MTFLASCRLHRLDRVAGIDRPLERIGRDHFDDVGNLHHVEQRGDARHEILAGGGRRRDDRVVCAGERDDQRGQRLGEHVLVSGGVGEQHLVDAVELGGRLGDRAAPLPATSTCTSPPSALRRGERLVGGVLECLVVVLGDAEGSVIQSTPASFLSLLDQFGDRADLDAGLAARRLDRLETRAAA